MKTYFYELFVENSVLLSWSLLYTLERQVDMKKIKYSKDVDTLLIELSDKPISYAEEDGQVILHYSNDDMLVLIEVLDFRQFISEDTTAELVSIS